MPIDFTSDPVGCVIQCGDGGCYLAVLSTGRPNRPPPPKVVELTVAQAASRLSLSVSAVRDMARTGRLAARSVSGPGGRIWRISGEAVDTLIERRPARSPRPASLDEVGVTEAAAILGVTGRTIMTMAGDGRLTARKNGVRWLINRSALEAVARA